MARYEVTAEMVERIENAIIKPEVSKANVTVNSILAKDDEDNYKHPEIINALYYGKKSNSMMKLDEGKYAYLSSSLDKDGNITSVNYSEPLSVAKIFGVEESELKNVPVGDKFFENVEAVKNFRENGVLVFDSALIGNKYNLVKAEGMREVCERLVSRSYAKRFEDGKLKASYPVFSSAPEKVVYVAASKEVTDKATGEVKQKFDPSKAEIRPATVSEKANAYVVMGPDHKLSIVLIENLVKRIEKRLSAGTTSLMRGAELTPEMKESFANGESLVLGIGCKEQNHFPVVFTVNHNGDIVTANPDSLGYDKVKAQGWKEVREKFPKESQEAAEKVEKEAAQDVAEKPAKKASTKKTTVKKEAAEKKSGMKVR